jgi:hypothetical protein
VGRQSKRKGRDVGKDKEESKPWKGQLLCDLIKDRLVKRSDGMSSNPPEYAAPLPQVHNLKNIF